MSVKINLQTTFPSMSFLCAKNGRKSLLIAGSKRLASSNSSSGRDYLIDVPIINRSFNFGDGEIIGNFTSPTNCHGTWSVNFYWDYCGGTLVGSGSWNASPTSMKPRQTWKVFGIIPSLYQLFLLLVHPLISICFGKTLLIFTYKIF